MEIDCPGGASCATWEARGYFELRRRAVVQNETPTLVLEIVRPGRRPERRAIGAGRTIIGRESGDIVLDDPESSAIHAEIELAGGRVIVRDLGSSNGTWRGDQRLPQFALFVGQSFRCGASEIRLVSLEGAADVPTPGRTAVGTKRALIGDATPAESSSTLVGMPPPSASRSSGPSRETEIPTSAPPQGEAFARSTGTLPGPPSFSADPASPPHPPIAAAPFPIPDLPPSAEPQPVSEAAPIPETPAASPPPPESLYRPPVANAVIKEGGAAKPPKSAATPRTRAGGRVLAWIGYGVGLLVLVVGLGLGGIWLWQGLRADFAEMVARTLPEDTLGFVAVRSPRALVELHGDEIPETARNEAIEELGIDPFALETYRDRGVDVDAPLGFAVLGVDPPVFAFTMGVADAEALDKALRQDVPTWIDRDEEDLRWVDRKFGDTEGLWLDAPVPVAALPDEDRFTFVGSFDDDASDAVVEQAEALASLEKGKSLADRPGFQGMAPSPGEMLALLYVDGPSSRAAIPGGPLETMVLRMALADIDGLAVSLSTDGGHIHLTTQTIMREGADALELMNRPRKAEALAKIPSPVLAELDFVVSPEALDKLSNALVGLSEVVFRELEKELREELGINLRAEVIENIDGAFGYALTRLPETDDPKDVGIVAFVSVRDEEKARATAERVYAKAHEKAAASLEQVAGVDVYRLEESPVPAAAFVHAGHLWIVLGEVELAAIIEGKEPSFAAEPRHRAIADALKKGGLAAGFVDIRELLHAARPLMGQEGREAERRLAGVVSPLEVITLRSEREGRAFVTTLTLHTVLEDALPELVQRGMKVAGELHEHRRAQVVRAEKCLELSERITRLMLEEAPTADNYAVDARLREGCEDLPAERLRCYLNAEALSDLRACETARAPVNSNAEPIAVPYVDDIWPHRVDGGTGRPEGEVNYGVDLGTSPQTRGPEDALVTIVQFGDFQCPYCGQMTATLDQVLAAHGKEVRLVYRHFPLEMHKEARLAARAAIAAARQDKFWAMHDRLYERQSEISEDAVRRWAGELGLDTVLFDRDFYDASTDRQIDDDLAAGKRFGIRGTPSFFINGRFVSGTQSRAALEALVEEEKKRALMFVERRGNTRVRLYADMIALFAPEVRRGNSGTIPTVSDTRHLVSAVGLPSKGATGFARVQIIECADFDCPYCDKVRPTIREILDAYPTQVVFSFAHNPLSFHAGAEPAARAAVAAASQGKFWEMHDRLFDDRKARSQADFEAMASDLGLDVEQFKRDMADAKTAESVREQQKMCTDNEATGTPSFFINGRLVSGAQDFEAFRAVIDEELAGGI